MIKTYLRLALKASSRPRNFALFSTYPKHEIVGMPALSPTMATGTISSWKKQVGDKCVPGDNIAEIETDKASMAFESQEEFYIAKHLVPAGTEVKVGDAIFIAVEEANLVSAFEKYQISAVSSNTPPTKAAEAPKKTVEAPPKVVEAEKKSEKPNPATATTPAMNVTTPPKSVPKTDSAPSTLVQPPSGAVSNYYSYRNTSAQMSSPLANKLKSDQLAYLIKYGRLNHIPEVKKSEKSSK